VNGWLSSGCGRIEAAIRGAGYTPPTQTSAPAVYDALKDLNTFYAAGMAELTRLGVRLGPRDRSRGQFLMEMFDNGLAKLLKTDLGRAGLDSAGIGTLFVGGISIDDKDIQETDDDRVPPRFQRDMFDFPGTVDTSTAATSGSTTR